MCIRDREEEGSDEKSGSGSGSDEDGSGSGDESGDGSGSEEGSGSGSGSGSGDGSDDDEEGSESEEDEESGKGKKKKKKEEQKEDKFEYVPTKFQSLMSALQNINSELDGTAKTVSALDSTVARTRTSGGGRLDAKALLSEIDRELKKGQGGYSSGDDQDAKRPRNYHPPESPVRRVFEDGVEMGSSYQ